MRLNHFILQKSYDDQKMGTREVKSLADSIISNAETNGYIPIKRSFVEEVSDRLIKGGNDATFG
jgi:hypothetical protein